MQCFSRGTTTSALKVTQNPQCLLIRHLDHTHPTSPLLTQPPELTEEAKLAASIKFVAANTVGESLKSIIKQDPVF